MGSDTSDMGTFHGIEANAALLVFAGSKMTSITLASIINQLFQNTGALKKTTEEMHSTFQTEDAITPATVATLEYPTAIIQEGIRMGSPAAIGLPRVIPKEGARICGPPMFQEACDTLDMLRRYEHKLTFRRLSWR
jgi:cytochrome P450